MINKLKDLSEIIKHLENGSITSTELVHHYLNKINLLDKDYNSISSINKTAFKIAKKLDLERKNNSIRSKLHGIPILIKDNIDLKGTNNTANSYIMRNNLSKKDAEIVKILKDKGLIIIGKANLSEWAYFMSDKKMPSGFGSLNGQVKHAFNNKIDPLGSSTGSAVAVALNFSPISIGTETNGSLIAPAYQNQIVSLRPTYGLLSNKGIIPISFFQDTPGPMAKNVYDLALLFEVITNKEITKDLDNTKEFKIGILNFSNYPNDKNDNEIINEMKETLKYCCTYKILNMKYTPVDNSETLFYEMKYSLNKYLEKNDNPEIKSLDDIIKLNIKNKERCLKYGQDLLIKSNNTSGKIDDPDYIYKRRKLLDKSQLFENILYENNLDAIVSTRWIGETPIIGLPSIVVPSFYKNDVVKSLVFFGKKNQDETLIKIAYKYEKERKKFI
tara:strand:+ start:779 stop:2110 length:1332 start_codon:yes stop_codon:yes gene_type:complete